MREKRRKKRGTGTSEGSWGGARTATEGSSIGRSPAPLWGQEEERPWLCCWVVGVSLRGGRRRVGGGVCLWSFCVIRSCGCGVSMSLGFAGSGVWAVRRRCSPKRSVGVYCGGGRGGGVSPSVALCCGTAVPWASALLGLLPMPATMPVPHCISKNGIAVVCIPFWCRSAKGHSVYRWEQEVEGSNQGITWVEKLTEFSAILSWLPFISGWLWCFCVRQLFWVWIASSTNTSFPLTPLVSLFWF